MDKLKTISFFQQIEKEIKEIKTPEEKTKILLSFIEAEYNRNLNINISNILYKGLNEMFKEINKYEILPELEMAKVIINHYQLSQTFNLTAIPNAVSYDYKVKFELLNDLIKKIILE